MTQLELDFGEEFAPKGKTDLIVEMAESCGFTRTHLGEVKLWICNRNDIERLIQLVKTK
jgi:hypothetical protein